MRLSITDEALGVIMDILNDVWDRAALDARLVIEDKFDDFNREWFSREVAWDDL